MLSIALAIIVTGFQAPTLVGTWIGHSSAGKYRISRTVTFQRDGSYRERSIGSNGTGSTAIDVEGTYTLAAGKLTVVQLSTVITDPATKKQHYVSKKPFSITVPLKFVDRDHFDFGHDSANLVRFTRVKAPKI